MNRIAQFLFIVAALLPRTSLPAPGPSTETLYLRAWTFKDFDAMYDLSSGETHRVLSHDQFAAAAAKLPAPSAEPQIVSRSVLGDAEHIYVQWSVAGTDSPARASIVLKNGQVEQPELLAAAQPVAVTTALTSPSPTTA